MTDTFKKASAKDIAMKTGKNLVFNGVDIFRELSAAYTNYVAQQYEQFGMSVGSALALVFIGEEILLSPDGEKLKEIIEVYDFASLDNDLDTPEMNAQYRQYLMCLLEMHNGKEVECNHNISAPDGIKIPEFEEITQEDIEEMIDGSFYNDLEEQKKFLM